MTYAKHFNPRVTPQNVPTPGKKQVKNNAGGYVYEISNWNQFHRFLILGSEKGTYYVSESKLTIENAENVIKCVQENGVRAVDTIVDVSDRGLAAKNSPCLFALALAASTENPDTRKYALANLSKVARIGTHLFEFTNYVNMFRGWGKNLRESMSSWYLSQSPSDLAYQIVKYPQRTTEEGVSTSVWSHRDILRKAHPKASGLHNDILSYVTKGWNEIPASVPNELKVILGTELVKKASTAKEVTSLINQYNLPREVIPKQFLSDPEVMRSLLTKMPYIATMRNLGNLTRLGVLSPLSKELNLVIERLTDDQQIAKSRVHPINILAALKTYASGGGYKGKNTWAPNQKIVDALNTAMYKSFKNVVPTGKNILIALDISGSMGSPCMGMEQITALEAGALMALAVANSEKNYHLVGFTAKGWGGTQSMHRYLTCSLSELQISPQQRFDHTLSYLQTLQMGGTDCSLPMLYAIDKKLDVDCFVVISDNETYFGSIKPDQALNEYRRKFNKNAKMIVLATSATKFSIADPNDPGMLDISGFSSDVPQVVSNFIAGAF